MTPAMALGITITFGRLAKALASDAAVMIRIKLGHEAQR
jgi:hypothetical protein